MTEQHPITPPPELVEQWRTAPEYASALEKLTMVTMTDRRLQEIATQAARWGADQQLTADAKWLDHNALNEPHLRITPVGEALKAAMRPKPLSLKEQALKILEEEPEADDMKELIVFDTAQVEIIRRALESLPE